MIGKNIQKLRKEKNMSQEQLAEKLNVTRQAVSNWETEKTQPDIETLNKIAIIFEVSIEKLIYGKEKRNVTIVRENTTEGVKKGVSFGAVLAIVISYAKWHSIGFAIIHGLLNWFFVIYYILKYGWS